MGFKRYKWGSMMVQKSHAGFKALMFSMKICDINHCLGYNVGSKITSENC